VIEDIYWRTKTSAHPEGESIWIGLHQPAPAA
jgi:pyruvate ferredoxin oxidoreductase alpha subunit